MKGGRRFAISQRKLPGPLFFSLALTAASLFAPDGRLDWANAWVLLAVSLVAGLAFTAGRDPELRIERRNIKAGQSWDKIIVGITVLVGPMAIWITAGLDDRFHWSNSISPLLVAAGVAVFMLGAGMLAWAMRSNRFFSAVVRIQKERGHAVVVDGPYRFIRHPGYAGMTASVLATPLILALDWALVPAVVTAAMIVLRAALEDRTLRGELKGYTDLPAGCVTSCCLAYGELKSSWLPECTSQQYEG